MKRWFARIGAELLGWYLIRTSRKAMDASTARIYAWENPHRIGPAELQVYIENYHKTWGRYRRVLPTYQRLREIENATD